MTDDRSTTLDSPTPPDTAAGESTHPLTETGKEAGQRASHLVERGADIGFNQADRGLDQAATGVESVADSIRRVSADMEAEQPQLAEFASTAADQAESLAGYLRENDVRQIIGNVEDYARRQPLLFIGGAFLLGMAASRFIKAAGGQGQRSGHPSGYAASYDVGTDRSTVDSGHWAHAGSGAARTSEMREPEDSRSIGTLFGDLGRQVSTIVRKEIDLARVEILSGIGRMGRGAATTAAGGALIYAGLLVVLGAIVLALIDAGLDPWLAALIVGAVALLVGGLVTALGVQQVRSTELAPKQTAETVRENVEFVKEQVK